jgi:hypothetical protein
MKQTYRIPVRFIFRGDFYIKAENPGQAEEYAEKHCGLVIGGGIHSTLPADEVDWDFEVHPDMHIFRAKKTRTTIPLPPY